MSDTSHGAGSPREGGNSPAPSRPGGTAPKGMDDYSEVLGMTPREHERRMRKWYVLLAIVGFFGVFGEGILMMLSKRRAAREAGATDAAPVVPAAPSGVPAPNAAPR